MTFIIPPNELVQINATIIAGVLVLLLVTKFFNREIDPKDDLLTHPRKMVGTVIPLFALSSSIILLQDGFTFTSILLDAFADILSMCGFAALVISVVAISVTPNTRKKKLSKEKDKSFRSSLKEVILKLFRMVVGIKNDEEILKNKRKRWRKQMAHRYKKFFKQS